MAIERPNWKLPAGITALTTTRDGGASSGDYAGFNLGAHVDDSPRDVRANRNSLAYCLPAGSRLHWLEQEHGVRTLEAGAATDYRADAIFSSTRGEACIVQTADCLPLLLCAADGSAVAAVHAGWRGLLKGVIEQAVGALPAAPDTLLAWLGPAIGPQHFEVGGEVRDAFLAASSAAALGATRACFKASSTRAGHYLANLHGLALVRLEALGVANCERDTRCTYSERDAFFSYRRDGRTGRMASLILINP